jgi:GT2 family glycosyltransferase
MGVSIIIPCLNAPGLADTIASLRRQARAAEIDEIIVVGMNTSDAWGHLDGVRWVSTERPVGPAAARNIGVRHARSSMLCFIDADCVAHDNWLAALLERHAAGNRIVGGSVCFDTDSYWRLVDNLSMFHEYMDTSPAGQRPYLPTLNLLIERTVFDAVGPLDESLLRGEDIDWTIRARRAGFELCFEPSARVIHRPDRSGLHRVLDHWWQSGMYMSHVRWRYRDEMKTPRLMRSRIGLIALSPVVALWITLRLFASNGGQWRFLHTAPAVFMTKMAWCLGAAGSRHVRLFSL